MTRRFSVAAIALGLGIMAFAATTLWRAAILPAFTLWNLTGSIPGKVFWALPAYRPIRRGDVVSLCLPRGTASEGLRRGYLERYDGAVHCATGIVPVIKVVAAVGGDIVDERAQGVYIDGRLLAHSRPLRTDPSGRRLKPAFGRHLLRPGQLWLMGTAALSWDARYWGAMPVSRVLRLCFRRDGPQPLLTIYAKTEDTHAKK